VSIGWLIAFHVLNSAGFANVFRFRSRFTRGSSRQNCSEKTPMIRTPMMVADNAPRGPRVKRERNRKDIGKACAVQNVEGISQPIDTCPPETGGDRRADHERKHAGTAIRLNCDLVDLSRFREIFSTTAARTRRR